MYSQHAAEISSIYTLQHLLGKTEHPFIVQRVMMPPLFKCRIEKHFNLTIVFSILRCGDILLTVNEHNLSSTTHAAAVEILKRIDGAVTLSVVSWPGTVV